jgi:hypothetical protein
MKNKCHSGEDQNQWKCKNTLVYKFLENLKSWIVIWIGFLATLLIWWTLYAMLNGNWNDPEEVNSWETLTSSAWNNMWNNIKYLWEFVNSSYSLEEQWTGKYWIDGKKIYQKTINIWELVIWQKEVSTDISNMDKLIHMYWYSYTYNWDWLGNNAAIPLPSYIVTDSTTATNQWVYIWYGITDGKLRIGNYDEYLASKYLEWYVTLYYTCTDR